MGRVVEQTRDEGMRTADKYLTVSVNGHVYAVKISFVRKIVVLSHVAFRPREEPYILGSTKVDEAIYMVVDLRILFGGRQKELPKPTVAVLLTCGEAEMCAVVDGVLSVVDVEVGQVMRPLNQNGCISGIARIDHADINILSMDETMTNAGMGRCRTSGSSTLE